MFWRRHAIRDDDLSAYVDGQLDGDARARLEAHVETCSACQETLAELRGLRSAMRSLPRASAPRSFALREGDVRPAASEPAGAFARAVPMLGGLTAAAVLAFVVMLGFDVTVSVDELDEGRSATLSSQPEALPADADGDVAPAPNAERDGQSVPGTGDAPDGDGSEFLGPSEDGEDIQEQYSVNHENLDEDGATEPEGAAAPDGEEPGTAGGAEIDYATADDGDGWPAIRVAEAAAAGVALAAGGSLTAVWWRRRET